tara:strand:+ start:228 stop:629 length:402 start_codon:yes stop_codon:yes gene_type:complete
MFGLFFLLATATAADPQFTKLKKGEVAPWEGRLFNDEAVAKFIVEDNLKIEQCEIQTTYELSKLRADLDLKHTKEMIELQTQNAILNQKVALRDQRIKGLEELKTPPNSFLWTAVGFIAGAGVTVGITYAVNQ